MARGGIENITIPSFDRTLRTLDPEGIEWDIQHAVDQGFAATLLALNAGLSPREMRRFIEIAVTAADDRVAVGIEMPLDSFPLAGELLAFAGSAGVDHVLLGVPHGWIPASEDVVYDAYAGLLSEGGPSAILPIGPVGFPPELGGGVPWAAFARLAAEGQVSGAHITTPLPQQVFAAVQMFAGRLDVGVGTPLLLGMLPLLHREYGVAWLSPDHWELWQSPEQPYLVRYLEHVAAGRKQEALDIHWRLGPARAIAAGSGLLELELDGMPHLALAKYLSWSVGGNGGITREPALHLKTHQLEGRQAMLRALGIEPRSDEAEFLVGRTQAAA